VGLFANKYRIESSRLKNWNYSSPWWYFVTICCLNHNNFFGKISDGQIILSPKGKILRNNFILLTRKFPNIYLGEYVIMPNHVHILIKLKYQGIQIFERDGINAVSNTKIPKGFRRGKNQMTENSLPRIVQWLKAKTTHDIRRELNVFFAWQSRYYDEIVKNQKQFQTISHYIQNNPINWHHDKLYT